MKQYTENLIKNIALLGHGGSGKTTLADAILYYAGAVDRIGKTGDSTTVMDFDPEENAAEWIRLEILFEGQTEPFSYLLVYENNVDNNTFTDYRLSKGEKYP